ncbi:MAG: hypothetical protein Ct9H300mP19_04270 [Dehalococcoidia bacterium]|nr:MAG: hypothetical protein Ct9H300mP19_04270 [Dehalococcoidia bacterium]
MFRAFQRRFHGQSGPQTASRFLLEIPESLVTTRDIRGHSRVADRIPDPMWTKRAASTPAPRPATRSADEFAPGEKVKHDVFGEGVVVSSSGSGSDTQVPVAFVGEGVKRLMLSFAPIERISMRLLIRMKTNRKFRIRIFSLHRRILDGFLKK